MFDVYHEEYLNQLSTQTTPTCPDCGGYIAFLNLEGSEHIFPNENNGKEFAQCTNCSFLSHISPRIYPAFKYANRLMKDLPSDILDEFATYFWDWCVDYDLGETVGSVFDRVSIAIATFQP
jgi:hypothetical protein